MIEVIKRSVVPIVAGLILYASFRYDIWALAILAIVFFYRRLVDNSLQTRLFVAVSFASGFFVPLLWWIAVIGNDALILLCALCVAIFSLIALVPVTKQSVWSKVEFAALWAILELFRAHFPWGGFSWGLLGYSQTSGPLVQYSRIGNALLVAFVVVLVATLISELKFFGNFGQSMVALVLIFSGFMFATPRPSGIVTVGVVQGGVVPKQIPESAKAGQVFANHVQQTRLNAATLRKADLVVWPENAVNLQSNEISVKQQIQKTVDEIGRPFLIGAVRTGVTGQPENVVILWSPKDGETSSYVKNHLVPFGEYIPMRSLLAPHIARFEQIPDDFHRGQGGGVLEVAGTRLGVAICFEVADQLHLSDLVTNGAQLFVAASNNATYLGSQQPAQQFAISRFSAIAHERSMVVATTSGVSGLISPSGKVSDLIASVSGAVFVAKVSLHNEKAFTDKFPAVKYAFVFGLFGLMIVRRLRSKSFMSVSNSPTE